MKRTEMDKRGKLVCSTLGWFAGKMDEILREPKNLRKRQWPNVGIDFLQNEVSFYSAHVRGDSVTIRDCIHLANYAMMIADKLRAEKGE